MTTIRNRVSPEYVSETLRVWDGDGIRATESIARMLTGTSRPPMYVKHLVYALTMGARMYELGQMAQEAFDNDDDDDTQS